MLETRRRLLQAVTIWPALRMLRGAAKEFWVNKAPADWSEDEKRVLLRQSPWALDGIVKFESGKKRETKPYEGVARPGGNVPGSRPNERPGGVVSVPIGEPVPPVPRDTSQSVEFEVLARWETAKPVRLAGGPELPEGTERFYVIGLRGLPLLPPPKGKQAEGAANPNQGLLEEIQKNSRIERKDRPAIPCEHLLTGSGPAATEVLLFFARGGRPITIAEKTVTLESRFGPFHLSIKFPLKEMVFQGSLAL